MNPLVSILIPCYNAERYIGESIDSSLAQDYTPIEVIVVDDGSTDESLAVVKQYASHGNFRFETGPNRGGNAARNRLLELARGEFIQFLDADDTLLANKIAIQIEHFNAGIDAVFCDYVEFDGKNPTDEHLVDYPEAIGDLLEYFFSHAVITMLPLHRRRLLIKAGGFDESFPCCQEYELHLRLAASHWRGVVHVAKPLCRRRRLSTSVSADESRVFATQAKLLYKWYEKLLQDNSLTKGRVDAIAKSLYGCGRHLARHGDSKGSKDAFRMAKRLNRQIQFAGNLVMRALCRFLGPYRAERLRSLVVYFLAVLKE